MESLLREWLALQCQATRGAEAALARVLPSAGAGVVVEWPAPGPLSHRLAALVSLACERGGPVVQPPAAAAGAAGALHLAVPLARDRRIVGAVAFAIRGVPATEGKACAERLALAARGLSLLLETDGARERLAHRVAAADRLLEHDRLAPASHALAGELARALGCERVAVGRWRRGRCEVIGLSSAPRFAADAGLVRELAAAMEEALDQDAPLTLPAAPDDPVRITRAHAALLRSTGAGAVYTVPLAAHGRPAGALVMTWAEAADLGDDRRARVQAAGSACGPILALHGRAEEGPLARARARLERFAARHFGAERGLAKATLASALALALLLAALPAPHRVSARAVLEGRMQRALVAGVDGVLAEAHVRPGDLVAAGSVLATLDDRDLQLERRQRDGLRAQLEQEYRQALAAGDRARITILRARIDQADAQLGLVDERLARTTVVAPFEGIVLEGDLGRAVGSPVKQGDVLFEIAPVDGYRIIVEVDGRDVADVSPGQSGRLALAALPGRTLPLRVERVTPISSTRDGRSFFRVEAALETPLGSLRPGMEGVAKIDAGRRRLLWIWTHGLVDWLRLATWSWLP